MKKRWMNYTKYLSEGEWHIHTNFVDGLSSVIEYCCFAEKANLPLLAFTEHVRRVLTYDFNKFVSQISSARKNFDLIVLAGCEAKVLDIDGTLDISTEVLKKSELVLGAFHSFPKYKRHELLFALENMLKNPHVDIWAHPSSFFQKIDSIITEKELSKIAELCIKNDVAVEKNVRHPLEKYILDFFEQRNVVFVNGSDAHSVQELKKIRV